MRSRIWRSSARVGYPGLQHEAVDLGLGQGVGPLLLDGVLGGEHEERVGQRVRDLAERHLPLLHRLEERRLDLGGGAVDLVGEEEIGEDRAPPRHELAGPLLEDHRPHEVGGKQVGGELDARELQVEGLAQRLHGEGLGEAGDALDQQVAAAEQRHHHALDEGLLPDDDLADLVDRGLDLERLLANGLVELDDVDLGLCHCPFPKNPFARGRTVPQR
jgi:hypothetical protein